MTPVETALRSARVLHLTFLTTALLYIVVLIQIRPLEKPLDPVIVWATTFVCLSAIGVALFLRSRMVSGTAAKLSTSPQDAGLLNRWRTGVVISFTFAESVMLFGLVLKFLGARWNIAGAFFVVAILLLVAWTPKLDVSSGN